MNRPYILCVDDEKIVTDSLLSQLEATFGDRYDYEAASSVDEAWEVVDEIREDGAEVQLIVSDWLMPKQKGDAFLREVHEQYPSIQLIMLSGQADEDAIRQLEAIVPGFIFMRKPWNKEELMTLIATKLKTQVP
ncbi:MAG: response regulator [Bacteroidetes bacterium]|jgi:CheY-like chemotaxis protein|nr:response regulator [Bacteroidota bacterium]